MTTTHTFEDTGDAYDATQSRDDIKTGDTLACIEDQVVGLADTWPFAITIKNGHLHRMADGWTVERFLAGQAKYASVAITLDHVRVAVATANANRWPVDPRWLAAIAAQA